MGRKEAFCTTTGWQAKIGHVWLAAGVCGSETSDLGDRIVLKLHGHVFDGRFGAGNRPSGPGHGPKGGILHRHVWQAKIGHVWLAAGICGSEKTDL